jgi:hypothetical protein
MRGAYRSRDAPVACIAVVPVSKYLPRFLRPLCGLNRPGIPTILTLIKDGLRECVCEREGMGERAYERERVYERVYERECMRESV